MHPTRLAALCALAVLASACGGGGDGDAGPADAGPADTGSRRDTGTDAGPPPPPRPALPPLVQWVDPMIGTGGTGFNDIGSTYPGPSLPFGMIHPGPDSTTATGAVGFLHCSGYHSGDDYIAAFSHTRMNGVGIPEYGVVALMPTVGPMTDVLTGEMGYRSRFDPATETASPGHYAVTLQDHDVRVELTTALRVALHRYTWPAGAEGLVLFDVAHHLQTVDIVGGAITVLPATNELEGFVRFSGGYSGRFGGMDVHFVVRFDRPFATSGVWQAGTIHPGETTRTGPDVGAWVSFDTSSDRDVVAAVGISFLDVARARMNLEAEAVDLDFDRVGVAATAAWETELGRVEIEGRYEQDFRIFYTALYHSMLLPTLATEADGNYRGLDGLEHAAVGFTYYTDFSLWDTYRTLHPLVSLLWPDRARDFARTLVVMAEQWGSYPRWPLGIGETHGMLGDPAVVVLADTWERGIQDFDLAHAYALAQLSADGDPASGGRGGVAEYVALGYVPSESGTSVSRTQEYAIADAALATLATALGQTADAARYGARGGNYRNVWDASRGFFIGRARDGSFPAGFGATAWNDDYAEGDAWQYLWLAPQDPDGLAALLGGPDAARARLESFFAMSASERRLALPPIYYWHGNEPDLHAPFLFAAWGGPDAAARWSAWARATFYRDTPLGLPGNDDGGTMSAWYIFASLGFYPIAGTDGYWLGSPLLNRATLHLAGGDLVVEAPDASRSAIYVQDLQWNGAAIPRDRFAHASLAAGGTLHFVMSDTSSGP